MANKIQHRRGAIPGATQLDEGELAIATIAGQVFTRNLAGGNHLVGTPHTTIGVDVAAAATAQELADIPEAFVGTNQGMVPNTSGNASGVYLDGQGNWTTPAGSAPPLIDDDTFSTALNSNIASAESIKAYVDAQVATALASEMTYRGGYDAINNVPDLDVSPSGISIGDTYTVTNTGVFFGADVSAGNIIIAEVDNPTLESEWTIIKQDVTNLDNLALDGGSWS